MVSSDSAGWRKLCRWWREIVWRLVFHGSYQTWVSSPLPVTISPVSAVAHNQQIAFCSFRYRQTRTTEGSSRKYRRHAATYCAISRAVASAPFSAINSVGIAQQTECCDHRHPGLEQNISSMIFCASSPIEFTHGGNSNFFLRFIRLIFGCRSHAARFAARGLTVRQAIQYSVNSASARQRWRYTASRRNERSSNNQNRRPGRARCRDGGDNSHRESRSALCGSIS